MSILFHRAEYCSDFNTYVDPYELLSTKDPIHRVCRLLLHVRRHMTVETQRIAMLECPSISLTTFGLIPLASNSVARYVAGHESACGETQLFAIVGETSCAQTPNAASDSLCCGKHQIIVMPRLAKLEPLFRLAYSMSP